MSTANCFGDAGLDLAPNGPVQSKRVQVAYGKNEIIKFAILIALHIVQYQKGNITITGT